MDKEMQSELQQRIIRSLLGCCLIRDQFCQIYHRVLIRCFNEIQVGKAGGGVGNWAATGHVVRCEGESAGLVTDCSGDTSGWVSTKDCSQTNQINQGGCGTTVL